MIDNPLNKFDPDSPEAKDAELLEQIFIAGIKAVIDSPALTKERIARGR